MSLRTEENPAAVLVALPFDLDAVPNQGLTQVVHDISESRWRVVQG
jgi:hypothetical protein